ncbi:MAG: 4Fe-4S binding protein [Chloroflexota bacterium]|nr:4Fe-4S binding protein [Chloroflexota bacterium]
MKRGTTIKREVDRKLVLERKMIVRPYRLELDREKCIGCQIGMLACPQEAVGLSPALLKDGRLAEKPLVDIDPSKCNFCGECVVLCPVNALSLTINGEPEIPVVKWEAFPTLVKEITVEVEKCKPDCELACQESCPVECIEVNVERDEKGEIARILDVKINREECIYCKQCEVACPEGAISVIKPWRGILRLDVKRCPEGCQACVDICPTDALTIKDGQLVFDERFCLYCGACQEVCPEEGAILVERYRILHSEIKSAAWTDALEKLVSLEVAAQELEAKSQSKRRDVISYLPGAPREEG